MALKAKQLKMPPADAAPEVEAEAAKRKKKRAPSHATYIFKVLKQVHPKLRISKQAMAVMESCVADTFERLASEAGKLSRMSRRDTVLSNDVQASVRLVLPGELGMHAVSEGCKAVMKIGTGRGGA
mmetsp:Transcript_35780/g.106237  ORF Transcript_35780/g.106237 Transcript_35780/m.106237 type:complete len:126 (-) Transcript_35780:47-424(-)